MDDSERLTGTEVSREPILPRKRGASKPAEKRQRRTSTQARIALAMVETHLKGTYDQMELLEKAIAELKESIS